MKLHRTYTSKGFTLVELLVVIGIIALLISILLPSLARARQAAVKISCASREHQIYLAMMMYANDNRDCLPFAPSGDVGAGMITNGFGLGMVPYLSGTFTPGTSSQGSQYGKMNRPDHVLQCPGQAVDQIAVAVGFGDPSEIITYRLPCLAPIDNTIGGGQPEKVILGGGGWPKFSQLAQPGRNVVFVDDITADFTVPGVQPNYPRLASYQPHGSGKALGGNTCWGDGSVQWLPVTGNAIAYACQNGGDPTCTSRIFYMDDGVAGAAGQQWWNQWTFPPYGSMWVKPNGDWKYDSDVGWGSWCLQSAKGVLY